MDSYLKGTLWLMPIVCTLPYVSCTDACPSDCWCTGDGAVKCVGHAITDIPEQLPLHTYLLQLNDTKMSVINEQSLANKDLLLRFSLSHSHLHTIHPRAFYAAPQLKSLKLSSNDLVTIPAGVLSPLTTLEQLHLDGNQLETINSNMFEGLVELQELDLSRNRLTSPTSGVFDGLTNLTFLNLGRNNIKTLPRDIFNSLTKLRKLTIYNNELEVLETGMFDELLNLEELKLHYNQIASLPAQVFWSLRNLNILTLSSNRLQLIPDRSFYNMPELTQLTLYKNPLLTLPDQLMGKMPKMKVFYLYATNLTTVPGNLFANMSGLLHLNLHLNDQLRDLPPDLFCCLLSLQKLSLKSNDLHYLHPQLFLRLTALSALLLNDNKLQSLPEDVFQSLTQLTAIELKNNDLRTLPGNIFLSNARLKGVTLSNNPWNCSCSIRDIARWIRQNDRLVTDKGDVMCHSPPYQLLRTVGSLRDEDFDVCESPRFRSQFSGRSYSHEPTRPFRSTSQPVQTLPAALTALPKRLPIAMTTSTADPSTPSDATATAPPDMVPFTGHVSRPFYDMLVVEQRPEFIHHNRHGGWVYVWFLTSSSALAGFLMFCHILLVLTGFCLVLAALVGMYRLNKTLVDLKTEQTPQGNATYYQGCCPVD